jgi:tetratricopeptide (TPR) repeat protein
MTSLIRGIAVTFAFATLAPAVVAQARADVPQDSTIRRFNVSDLDLNREQRAELQAVLDKKDYKSAEKLLVAEIDRDPKSFRAAGLLEFAGGIFFLDGEYLNAAIAWKKSEAIAPLAEESGFTLAMAYVKLRRPDWARPELQKLSESHPQNALYAYWLARLDYDAQKYNEAIAKLGKVISLDPKMARAYDLLGLCFDYVGRLDDAIKNLDHAAELNRSQAHPSPWPNVDLATVQIEKNQLSEAEASLGEAIGFDSRLPQAHYQLGRVLAKQGRLAEATKALKTSATLDPTYPEPHFLLGRIYHQTGHTQLGDDEIQQFQQLQKQASDSSAAKPMTTR